MSDQTPISLDQAVSSFIGGTPSEQPEAEAAPKDDQTPEAADLSESEDEPEEQPADGEETETQDSEEDDTGETDDEEGEEGEEDEEPSFTISLDGKEQEVSLSELRDGYLRQADYTRKTQAFAEQRKHLETQAEQAARKREELVTLLEAVPQQLLGTPPAKPDISLARSDPATYEEQKYAFEQWHAMRAGFEQWRAKVVQERDSETAGKRVDLAKSEGQKFLTAFADDVKDEASMNAKVGEIHTYLHSTFGYAQEELAGMIDHRAYVIADKARRYDALMSENRPKAELKAKKARLKPVTSGAAQRKPKRTSERDQAKQRFEQAASKPGANLNRKELLDSAVDAFLAGSGRG